MRGEEGLPGPPGAQGIQGITGGTGGPGKDGPMLPIPKCKGAVSDDKSICHGESNVNWNSFYNAGAYLDIDTSPCKMSDDDVQYFTFLTGNAYAESLTGGSAIYSPTKKGFRIYVASDIAGTQGWWPVQGWVMNQYRLRVSWVAVGKSTGPKSTAVCCGTGESKWAQSGPQSYQNVDAGACSMKGSPVWITAAEGGKAYGTSAFIGTNAAYSVGERFAMMFIRQSDIAKARDGGFSAAELSGGKNRLVPKYCQFGEPFPSGEQALDEGKISRDEYPCMGMRVVTAVQQNEAPTAINDQEAQCYLKRYADLQKAFGATNIAAAKGHWAQYGKNEKRDWSCPVSAMYFTSLKDTADGKSAMIRSASIYDPSPAVCPLPLPLSLCISPCTPSRFPDFRSCPGIACCTEKNIAMTGVPIVSQVTAWAADTHSQHGERLQFRRAVVWSRKPW